MGGDGVGVRRIVANLPAENPGELAAFYRALLGLEPMMEMTFIATLGTGAAGPVELSLVSDGGNGAPRPALSIEVEDIDVVLDRAREMGVEISYGPAEESWGVRRFFFADPEGNVVTVLQHAGGDA